MAPRPIESALLYGTAVVQGLALVTFPAASAVFTDPHGFAFSGTQYGTMFLPQVLMAILSSSLASRLAGRHGLKVVLLAGLAGDLVSMALLAASALLVGHPAAFPVVCLATAALGFGFGATVTALNSFGEGFSPERPDRAVLTLNALLGVGTALAPLLVTAFVGAGLWWLLPMLMTLALAGVAILARALPLQLAPGPPDAAAGAAPEHLPPRFWLYGGAVLLYGVLETLTGNWGTLYLSQERGVSPRDASFALTAFWIMVTVGRVIVAVLASVVPARLIYLALPALLAAAFVLAGRAGSASTGILAFGLLGLACSALLPLSLSFAGSEFPRLTAATAGGLLALYQVGYGVAAFGVGPLQEIGGVTLSRVFAGAAVVAVALLVVAFLLVRRATRPSGVRT
jgi:fucose permease